MHPKWDNRFYSVCHLYIAYQLCDQLNVGCNKNYGDVDVSDESNFIQPWCSEGNFPSLCEHFTLQASKSEVDSIISNSILKK